LESVYEACLCDELSLAGSSSVRQRRIAVTHKGKMLDDYFQTDIIVEERLALEIKAVHQMPPIRGAHPRTYLRLSNLPFGLPLNFNVLRMRHGISRMIGLVAVVPKASR
jgi:GxxExxY protein